MRILFAKLAMVAAVGMVCVGQAICQVAHLETPHYPALARQARVTGTVTVRVHINSDGKVASTEAISGPPLLSEPVRENASRWTFVPGIEETLEIAYEFQLQEGEVDCDPGATVSFDLPNKVLIVSNFQAPEEYTAILRPKKKRWWLLGR